MRKKNTPKYKKNKQDRTLNVLSPKKELRKIKYLPVLPLFLVITWAWAALYYGDVLRIAREHSFWVADPEQMKFVLDQSYGILWYVGRLALQTFRYPVLGGFILAFLLSVSSWLIGYCMHLKSKWRWAQYLPAIAYIFFLSYEGIDLFYEAETGRIMGIPVLATLTLVILSTIIRSFSKKNMPSFVKAQEDETPKQNYIQLGVCLCGLIGAIVYTQLARPHVPVISKMMLGQINQDWNGIIETAVKNTELSHRSIAAYHAMALVQTDQVGEHSFDLRMEYDSIHIHGWDGQYNNGNNLYIPEGSYYAGLVETCYHYAFEKLVMNGPGIHNLELLTKCALLRHEWKLAEKYLRILKQVPFEQSFCQKYAPMVRNPKLINADPEMAVIRMLEPIHDSFENLYQQPVFMGYNLSLYEGRSINAVKNSLAVCLYTKLMPDFISRLQPIAGTTPPSNFADGILLMSNKYPQLEKMFPNMDMRVSQLGAFLQEVNPYMKDRPKFARELFDKYKGYYPYYYFFGNLKATKKNSENKQTSNSGVN